MNKNNVIIGSIVLIIVCASGGFYAGMQYQSSKAPLGLTGRNTAFSRRFGQNLRPVRGQVLAMDSSSLTVKLPDKTTRIVIISGSTAFVKSTKASETDLKIGDAVNVSGTANPDGSITAWDVQINPPEPQRHTGVNQAPLSPTGLGY